MALDRWAPLQGYVFPYALRVPKTMRGNLSLEMRINLG